MIHDQHAFLRSRRSIRRFTPEPVDEAALRRILETATYAPSAHDRQPWRFVVLQTLEARVKLVDAVTGKFQADMHRAGVAQAIIQDRVDRTRRRTDEAPVIILLCRDVTRVDHQPDEAARQAETWMGRQSVAVAGLQLLLAAHAEGLGGTWICWPLFAPTEIIQALGLSDDWEPQALVFLGHPAESPEAPKRASVEEIVTFL